jgi:hypothetical protein
MVFLDFRDPECAAENLGWMALCKAITEEDEYLDKRIAVIVDADKGEIGSYNDRSIPICWDYFLPDNIFLQYGSADCGSSVINKLIKKCDKMAARVIKEVVSQNHREGLELSKNYPCKYFRQLTPNMDNPDWKIFINK